MSNTTSQKGFPSPHPERESARATAPENCLNDVITSGYTDWAPSNDLTGPDAGKFTCRICFDSKYRRPRHIPQHEATKTHRERLRYHLLISQDSQFQGSSTPADTHSPSDSGMTSAYSGIFENLSASVLPQDNPSDDLEAADSQPMASSSGQTSAFHPAYDWSQIDLGRLDDGADREKHATIARISQELLQYLNGELAWPDDEEKEQPRGGAGNADNESTAAQDKRP